MPTIKSYRKDRFTTIDNEVLQNPLLSWRAKGILTYLVGKPKDWTTRVADLINRSTEGRDAVRTAIAELKDHGYMVTLLIRDDYGKIVDNETYVSDRPEDLAELLGSRTSESDSLGSRTSDKPNAGESPPSNKETTTKERSLNKDEKKLLELLPDCDLEKKSLFKNSGVYEKEIFLQFFGPEYAPIDLDHYHDAIFRWNENRRIVRTPIGWILTCQTWIRRDAKKGQAVKSAAGVQATAENTMDFFKMGRG